MTRPVLVVRPEPGNAATCGRIASMGLRVIGLPLFAVAPVAWSAGPASAYDGVLLTSANAVRHAGECLRPYLALPAFAVGGATAEAATEAGFGQVIAGAGGVRDLLAAIARNASPRLLHLAGEEVTEAGLHGLTIDRHTVYRATVLPPPPTLADALAEAPVVLIHSPRAGGRLGALIQPSGRTAIALVAISAAAAAAAGGGWETVAIADEPREEAMLNLAARLCRAPQDGPAQ